MQTTLNRLTSPVRSRAAGTWLALFSLLTLCLCTPVANAAGSVPLPIVVSGAPTQLAALSGGGWDGSQEPIGGTFVVGANGDVLVGDGYTANFFQITPAGTETTLGGGVGGSAAALDIYGNLYFAGNYNANVYKVPYDAATGAYVGWGTGSAPTTNCLGDNKDTSPCIFAPAVSTLMGTLAGTGNSGYAGVAFDLKGNFFFESNTLPATNPNAIYECNVACISSSSATPTLIYADKSPVGALAVDPWGNIFFVDGNNSTGKVTNLNELPVSSGSYPSSPTVVVSYTNAAGYGNGISGLAISGTGTIYITTNGDGIFAMPNTQSGGPNVNGIYMISSQGGKGVALDSRGNVYGIPYNSGDVVSFIPVNNFTLGATTISGTATTASGTIFDSNGSCTPTLSLSVTEFGVPTSEFTAAAGTSCSTAFGGGNGTFSKGTLTAAAFTSFSVNLSFVANAAGERNAVLTTIDSTNDAVGVAALTGVGQGALANVDPGVLTTYTTGLTTPASVVADPAGDLFVADSGASKVYEFPAGSTSTTTPTSIGSGFVSPDALAFDANGDLFISDKGVPAIFEILNTGTSGAFVAGSQLTLISGTVTLGGQTLQYPDALAFGPHGTLYLADLTADAVFTYNPANGQLGISNATGANGLEAPAGIAVDASSNLYVADSSLNEIFEFAFGGGITTVTPPNVTKASGVAVDASGSLIVADGSSPNIVRIPNLSGTLTTSKAVTIETISPQASSLWMDPLGDLYVASAGGKSANAIQRTQGSINLGTVADGANNTGSVYLMNAGNETATLANPDVTEPASYPTFSLEPAATNGCTAGSTGPPAGLCAFTAEFAPPAGTTPGPYSGTADILVSTPSLSIPVTISGTASPSAAQPQTISWSPPTTGYVGQVIALVATATSGLPVSFSTTTPSICSLAGNTTAGFTASFLAAGTCTISANQAGGSVSGTLYGAAPTVTKSIAITTLTPTGVPSLLMTQHEWLWPLTSGGFTDGQTPAGGSFAVTQDGELVFGSTYGNTVYFVNVATGTLITNGANPAGGVPFNGPAAITVDSNNNLYFAHLYSSTIYKVPFVNGAYTTLTDCQLSTAPCGSTPPPACQGGTKDTAECTFVTYPSSPSPPNSGGLKAIAFDPSGNFYMVSEPSSATASAGATSAGASYIYECNTSCQPAGTGTVLYSDTTGGVSQIAFDPWGNLFFTDANYLVSGSNDESNAGASSSALWELPYSATSKSFASTPTLLQRFTNTSSGNYDDILASVAVSQTNGTIYYGVENDGTWAIPNTQTGGPVMADQYAISGQGAKGLELDAHGNIYFVNYGSGTTIAGTAFSGHDTAGVILLNNLTVPNAQYDGAPVTASATVVDNGIFYCPTPAATLALTFSGADASEFSATQGTGCTSSIGMYDATLSSPNTLTGYGSSSYPITITFAATVPNTSTATLTAADTTNGGEGTATVTGFGLTTPQTIAFTAPTVTTYTYTAPPSPVTITLSVANGGSNFPVAFSVDPSSTGAGTLSSTTVTGTTSSATLTVTQAGTIQIDATEPAGLASNHIYYNTSNTATLTLTINKASQSITFTPVTPSTYTYSPSPQVTVQLSATGGASGNPVTFSVDSSSTGAGTVSSSTQVGTASLATLTVTQAGSIVIDASQAGTVDYSPASLTDAQTLTINQAPQTITFIPPTQAIHFIAASSGIAGGITVQVSATGGGSDNPIVFTVDKSSTMTGSFGKSTVSGATSTATLTIPLQGSVVSGTIVIDATQPQSTDYAAVTVSPLATLTILPPLPLQTITFPLPLTQVGGTTLTLTATASSGLPVTYTSSTTSVCTVSGSTATFAKVTAVSSCTITASQPGDNINYAAAAPVPVTFLVNPPGEVPALNLSLSAGTVTIVPGTDGLTSITIASSNNFVGSITFACTGLPTGYTCTFNPNPATVSAGGFADTTLTITAPATAAVVRHDFRPLFPATLAVALFFLGFRKRNRLQLLLLLVVLFTGLGLISSCGGSSGPVVPPPVTSSITITATSGSYQTSVPLTVILE